MNDNQVIAIIDALEACTKALVKTIGYHGIESDMKDINNQLSDDVFDAKSRLI